MAGAVATPADRRLHAPAAERNGAAILEVLRRFHRPGLTVLELASGPGQHAAQFAAALPDINWQPSDPDPLMRESESAWAQGLANIAPPLDLDVEAEDWWRAAPAPVDMALAINLLHCVPRRALEGLAAGAGRLLAPGGVLLLYGPFTFNGVYGTAGNRSFDRMMRRQDPRWGLRDLNDIAAAGHRHGLAFERAVDMPAGNHILVLRRRRADGGEPCHG